jgi:hypothetical protein
VFDLINVLREYFNYSLDQHNALAKQKSVSNCLTGLLCTFQILDIGAGSAFNLDEKDFIDALYTVILRVYEEPLAIETSDFLALLKCLHIVFVQKKQLSQEVVIAFVKRLCILQMHLRDSEQAGVLLLIKQIVQKYSSARTAMLELDDDSIGGGFGISNFMY